MVLLRLENVTKRFGGLVAVNRVSLKINSGEFVGIVGPNGSGKTTLFNLISGVYFPDKGDVFFEGKNITRLPPYKRAPLGLGRTFQIPRPFGSATVRENVAVGAMFGSLGGKINVDESLELADQIIERIGLGEHRKKRASTLTAVEKKMMEIARALAMKPKLLLMDEAMAGMHPKDIDQTVSLIKQIAVEENIAIVAMVEHIMRAVLGMAEKVIVLHQGSKLVDAPTKEALEDSRVVEVYLGRPLEE
ncbi:MAG: ABC transporter ATP-binding protein [Deltaproteobacteria bacterium]|nr:ABC transporter ATP-binding protein [Deltaproteobacteria bacterium]MBW1918684.1 ABC transporter ATP-binding protein [Deltaproteobacteria bacterium]MBW1935286.1 ABC transporter ATP-binding protein [Deltaproteobacteria bacterium]MBW1978209.1 ABC transporter ATP-binding protein [Deltaproteobacteria bacterium]MBW2044566.1 ABC transporter ATP-binding protein [Deltaproteobacteria bacterium]